LILEFRIASSDENRAPIARGATATRRSRVIVNVVEGKKLTNVRASGKDEATILTPPIRMTLERAMSYIQDDELVEITPKSIRLRKRWLDPNERKKRERMSEAARAAG
jgi:GTP-binding protein